MKDYSSALKIIPKEFQSKFLFSGARYPAFIGGWATGKTMFGILRGLICSEEVKDNLGLIIRKEFTDLRDSTLQDFEKYTGIQVGTSKNVKLPNGSVIMFRHGDELDVLKNINLGWFMMEQAEEFTSDEQFEFLRGRLRRSNVPFHTGFVVGNTAGHNWIWRLWKQQQNPEYELIEATSFDNQENIPQATLEDWKRLEKESPQHYARYVMNSWEDFEEFDNLIPYAYIRNNINQGFIPSGGCILACDPADYGDDETVITILQRAGNGRYRQIYLISYQHQDSMQTAGRIIDLKKQYNPDYVIIDDIGLGRGITTRLSEQGIEVVRFIASSKALDDGFKNKRAECYWKLREMLRQELLDLQNNNKQTEQLATLKYGFKSNGRKYIESKEDAKRRGLKSPDYADALMMAVSVVELIPEPEKILTKAEQFWQMVKRDIELEQARREEDAVRPL